MMRAVRIGSLDAMMLLAVFAASTSGILGVAAASQQAVAVNY
jgi:hypothetical protein